MTETIRLSPLAEAISKRTRKLYEFEVSEVFKVTGNRVKVRVVTKAEQDLALVGAHKYAAGKASDMPDAAHDPDLLDDAKSAFVAFAACRDADEPDKFPAFPAPQWMLEHLTTDEVAHLVNLMNEVRVKESPSPMSISDEMIDGIAELCAANVSSEIPESVLASFTREYLTHVVVMLSARNVELRARVVELSEELEFATKELPKE